MKRENVIKLIIAGEGAVGKTSMIKRFVYNEFTDTKMTIGVSVASKTVIIDNQELLLSLWDFAGETNFRFVLPRFCLGALGALLVFDLTRMASFYSLPEWVALIRRGSGLIPIVLVGNKYDLAQQMNIQTPTSELENFQKRFEIYEYIETSAKNGNNIERAFQVLLQKIKTKRTHQAKKT